MLTGGRYRVVSVVGVVGLTAVAVAVANHPGVQYAVTTSVPVFDRLDATVLSGEPLYWAVLLSVLAVAGSLVPLYKPRPRRILDTAFLAGKRVAVAILALATLGYFDWPYRMPRTTLLVSAGLLLIAIPAWFVWIRWPDGSVGRTLIVGDDRRGIERVAPAVNAPVLGYLCPTSAEPPVDAARSDGGLALQRGERSRSIDGTDRLETLRRLGGLSRLDGALVEYDVDTAVLAFTRPDRAEFFGVLDACYERGVNAKVHREYADSVLVGDEGVGELVDVDFEPWDPLDRLFKRAFDVLVAVVGLLVFAPVVAAIAVAIKLDGPGPVLYSQERTAGFGETFTVYKFRTMVPEGEDARPVDDAANDRITRVGGALRATHLDELPQLWSILVGTMSVVGPRAVWVEEEALLEADAPAWRKRWFVKPGLTGLAQINGVGSTEPALKLRYDLEYIRRQSLRLDVKIVIRQVWTVLLEVRSAIRS